MCKPVHGHLRAAINSNSHGLACLDLLPCIQDVPIGNTFREPDDREVCLHLIRTLKTNPFSCEWTGSPHVLPSYQGSEKSWLIRFIVTFFISGYKRPVTAEAECVLNIDLPADLGIEKTTAQ